MSFVRSIKRLWRHILPHRRRQLCGLFFVMALASFAEVASIGAVLPFLGVLMAPETVFLSPIAKPFILGLGLTDSHQLIFPFTITFILAALISGATRIVLLWAQTRLGFAIGADFSIKIYKNSLYQPYSKHVQLNSSQIIAGISSKTNTTINYYLLPLLFVASSSLIFFAIMTALIFINPIVAFAAFGGFGSLYGVIILATKKRLQHDGLLMSQESNRVIKALQEGLGGIRDVLIDGTQAVYCKIYRDADLALRKSQANIQIIGGTPRYLIEAFGMILIAIVAFEMQSSNGGIASAIPVLGGIAIGAQRLLPVLQSMYYSLSNVRGHQSTLLDILDLLEQPLPAYADEAPPKPISFNKSICLDKIGFRYLRDGPLVLQDIKFNIQKGCRIGFIGTTGGGKSTLIDIVMGLLQPTTGKLVIDDEVITERTSRAWQMHIAHVPQSIFLADATVTENIAFGVPFKEIDHARVKYAAAKAQIGDIIESWPKQYDTFVGERGIRLSGGQRQRIGIARALYKQADVIVFDEATSALDKVTECAVMEAINSIDKDITVLIVAHRITTLRNCDQIVELDQGKIKWIGPYQEIINNEN